MKVIAHTGDGYLVEMSPRELAAITGQSTTNEYNGKPNVSTGAVMKTKEALDHLDKILNYEEQRKKMAEQLRAAATIIETTPSIMTLPPVEKPVAEQLREALS